VTDVILEGRRAVGVRTLQEPHVGDRVVLAAGVGTAVLCERLGIPIPVRSDPAVMFRFDASPGVIRSIVGGDGYEVRQLADGSLLCPAVYADEATRGALDERGRALALRLERTFRGLGPVALRSAEVGWRPMPVAGEPLIGFSSSVDGLYLAVMHSAVTLAASVGLLVAGEIATGEVPAELASLRPPV
jgi:glycine/D-amino acid oxidase-like deaminating enzyme